MPESSRQHGTSLRVAAVAILAAVWFEMLTLGTGPLDERLHQLLYAGGHPAWILVARVFTFLGEPAVLIGIGLLAGFALWMKGRGRFGLVIILVTLLGRGLAEVQKYSIMRFRPEDEAHLVPVSTPSFPSGHATSSMIVYLTLALVFATGRWKQPAVAAALLLSFCIGVSRIMLGVHWPTDVIGGWAFGLLWVLLVLHPAERVAQRGNMR